MLKVENSRPSQPWSQHCGRGRALAPRTGRSLESPEESAEGEWKTPSKGTDEAWGLIGEECEECVDLIPNGQLLYGEGDGKKWIGTITLDSGALTESCVLLGNSRWAGSSYMEMIWTRC